MKQMYFKYILVHFKVKEKNKWRSFIMSASKKIDRSIDPEKYSKRDGRKAN